MAQIDVLVLEDEPFTRESLVTALREGGLIVDAADGVAAALDVLAGSGARVLVADLRLAPGGGHAGATEGRRVALAAEQLDPALGVVFISGDPEALASRALGPRERALAKPFSSSALVEAVRELLPS